MSARQQPEGVGAGGVSRASRGLIRTRLLQARTRAEDDWSSWSDSTAAQLVELPPLTRLRALHTHQADLTAAAWHRVAESLLRPEPPPRDALPSHAEEPGLATARSTGQPRGLPWDRRGRDRTRPRPALGPDMADAPIQPAPDRPTRADLSGTGLPVRGAPERRFVERARPAAEPPMHATLLPSAPAAAAGAPGSADRAGPSPEPPPHDAAAPDLMLGVVVLAGLLLGLYWLFSERVL